MPLRIAQYGTGHGHAAGKARAMLRSHEVDFAGVFEPDPRALALAQRQAGLAGVRWLRSREEFLGDPSVAAVAIEGRNDESLAMAGEAVEAGKHLWLDKPAGDDWPAFQRIAVVARDRGLLIQVGYMLRYHEGFRQIAEWARSGLLGEVFAVRAHMSTNIPVERPDLPAGSRQSTGRHRGGIFYDLGAHMLDQLVWLLGRPRRVQAFLRNDATPDLPTFADNTLGVFEFDRSLAFVDIAAMEARPTARRFEVYGTRGSAILEPFDPSRQIRLCLEEAREGYAAGEQHLPLGAPSWQDLFERELSALAATLKGDRPPDRSLDHELLVQETLLRATGAIPGG